MKYFILSTGIFIFSIWITTVQASIDLYSATIEVKENSEVARQQDFQTALTAVLIKLSGNRQLPNSDAFQKQLANADQWVEEFGYSNNAEDNLVLTVHFTPNAVKQFMQRVGLPLWSPPRSAILSWVFLDFAEEIQVLTYEDYPDEAALMLEQAAERGLLTLFPLLDLQDRRLLTVTQLSQIDTENIENIAERYGVTVVLVGWLQSALSDKWSAEWRLFTGHGEENWQMGEEDLGVVLAKGINTAIDKLAPSISKNNNKPVITDVSLETIEIHVIDVPNLQAYAKIHEYLQSMEVVEQMQVLSMQPDEVTFRLAVRGGQANLDRGIGLSTVMKKIAENNYRYLP